MAFACQEAIDNDTRWMNLSMSVAFAGLFADNVSVTCTGQNSLQLISLALRVGAVEI